MNSHSLIKKCLPFVACSEDIFNDLQVKENLGYGSFGSVYAASAHQKKYALKIFNHKGAVFAESSFKLIAPLKSSYIVKQIKFKKTLFKTEVLMEFMQSDLLAYLATHQNLSWREKLRLMQEAVHGVVDLHQKDILHRDLKPENFLLDQNSHVKLADFDLAVKVKKASCFSVPEISYLGTGYYMAPETFNSGNISKASDVFSLGLTCVGICNGGLPPYDTNSFSIQYIKSVNIQPMIIESCPESLKVTLQSCFFKDPTKRPGAETLLQKLDDIAEHVVLSL